MAQLQPKQKELIAAFASVCEVEGDNLLGPWSCPELQNIFHSIGRQSPWKNHLQDSDLLRIIFWLLYRTTRLLPTGYRGAVKDAPDGTQMLAQFQNDLVQFLESIPRTYHAYFPLVGVPSLLTRDHQLTELISIIDTSIGDEQDAKLLEDAFPLANVVASMTGKPIPRLKRNQRYLRITTTGYADGSTSSPAAILVLAQLKQFLFFGLATGFLEELPTWRLGRFDNAMHDQSVVIRNESLNEDEEYSLSLPDEFYRYLLRMVVSEKAREYFDMSTGKTLLGGTLRQANTPEEVASAIKGKLGGFGEFLDIPQDDSDAIRIRAACEWWIDASASQNQTISFLQYCIGFEALLGENTKDRGITERLSDRFAYLLGKTQSQRSELRRRFRNVYERRGLIVHQREPHLRRFDSSARIEAKQMLLQAVVSEVNQLLKAKRQPA